MHGVIKHIFFFTFVPMNRKTIKSLSFTSWKGNAFVSGKFPHSINRLKNLGLLFIQITTQEESEKLELKYENIRV